MSKYLLIDCMEGFDKIAKCDTLTTLKKEARQYHWDTDGECALAYIVRNSDDNKFHISNRKPIYTEWNETDNGKTTVEVTIIK